MVGYIIITIGILIILAFLITYNSFIKSNNQVKEAFSTMDVYLKKRWDLIPNLVEVVKEYAQYEEDTLREVIELRNKIKSYDDLSDDSKITTNERMTLNISKIIAIAEAYPNLKANENFLNLQNNLKSVEDEIAQARKYYNAVVRNYNNKVEMFPSCIIAKIFGYTIKNMFEIDEERNNIKVEL